MNNVKVALLQLLPEENLQGNIIKGIKAVEKAAAMGADIALFPEMWSCGYCFPQDKTALDSLAVSHESEYTMTFAKAARDNDIAVAVTYLMKNEQGGAPYNSVTLFDRHGKEMFTYSKVHTCDFGYEKVLSHGTDFYTAQLDIKDGNVNVGAMICYDREFPESARILMLKGSEIILVPNACPMEINRISQLRARAYENMTGIATANYPYGTPDCNGHSTAFDGIAYRMDGSGGRDTLVIEAGEQEEIYLANFPIEDLWSAYRYDCKRAVYKRGEKSVTACTSHSVTHTVTVGNRKITYELARKKVKNINLRIKPDGTVHVSASTAVTIAVIERFIRERADFILGAIDKFNAKNENRKILFFSGEKLSLLGTQHILYVKKGIRNYATDSDGNITLYVTDTDDYELKYNTYITWLRSQCLPLMTRLCKRAYDEHYGKLGIDFPTIKVKDMRSRWGSCIPSKKILTFNVHLMEYPLPAAEYVVAHEFTHFLQANHSARFYAELARYMPDYKQREKLLK